MTGLRIAFIGSSRFGLRCLEAMHGLRGCEIVGAVTAPATFTTGRLKGAANATFADVAGWCAAQGGIPCEIAGSMKDPPLIEVVRGWAPDCFIVAGWHSLIPGSWFEIAPAYGLHASLLPDYSGGAPLVWQIIHGETRTGISLFQLAEGVDNGPLLGQLETHIAPDDTIATVYARIEELGLELLRRTLPRLADGTVEFTVQDESKRRIFPLRKPEDGLIDWSQPAENVRNFIRAQTRPYPGAFTMIGPDTITIWSAEAAPELGDLAPGSFGRRGEGLFVGCGEGTALCVTGMAVNGHDVAPDRWVGA